MKHKLTPTYANIKIKDTNKAATKTKQVTNSKNKKRIKILPNKEKWNKQPIYLQNNGVKIYGKNWPIIERANQARKK